MDNFPAEVGYRTVNYPIKVYGGKYLNVEETMDASTLWRLQQAIFHTRLDVLKKLLAEGYVPTGDDFLEVEIRVKRNVVSADATDGKWISLPVETRAWSVAKLDRPIYPMVDSTP